MASSAKTSASASRRATWRNWSSWWSDGAINKATGVEVLAEMWETGATRSSIVEAKGLAQISDSSAIEAAVAQTLAANDAMVQEYLERQG